MQLYEPKVASAETKDKTREPSLNRSFYDIQQQNEVDLFSQVPGSLCGAVDAAETQRHIITIHSSLFQTYLLSVKSVHSSVILVLYYNLVFVFTF